MSIPHLATLLVHYLDSQVTKFISFLDPPIHYNNIDNISSFAFEMPNTWTIVKNLYFGLPFSRPWYANYMDSFTLMFMYGCTYYVMSTSSNPWFIHRSGQQSLVAPTSENFSSPTNVPLDGNRFFHNFSLNNFLAKIIIIIALLIWNHAHVPTQNALCPIWLHPSILQLYGLPTHTFPPSLLAFLLQFPSNSSIHILPLNGS